MIGSVYGDPVSVNNLSTDADTDSLQRGLLGRDHRRLRTDAAPTNVNRGPAVADARERVRVPSSAYLVEGYHSTQARRPQTSTSSRTAGGSFDLLPPNST